MGTYFRVVNHTRREAFESPGAAVKAFGTAYHCGPLLVLLLIRRHWLGTDHIEVLGDDWGGDLYYETENWPEPAALAALRAELEPEPHN